MRKDLSTLNESGMRVRDVGKSALEERCRVVDVALEATLAATEFKGFPLVSEDGARILGGYIGRTELMYVLGTHARLVARFADIDGNCKDERGRRRISGPTRCACSRRTATGIWRTLI
jgi:hypothetical protein